DHRYHAGELPLSPSQSIEHRSDAVLVTSHFSSTSGCCHVTPWGMYRTTIEYPLGYCYRSTMSEHTHHHDVLTDLNPKHRALRKMIPDVYRGFGEMSNAALT